MLSGKIKLHLDPSVEADAVQAADELEAERQEQALLIKTAYARILSMADGEKKNKQLDAFEKNPTIQKALRFIKKSDAVVDETDARTLPNMMTALATPKPLKPLDINRSSPGNSSSGPKVGQDSPMTEHEKNTLVNQFNCKNGC